MRKTSGGGSTGTGKGPAAATGASAANVAPPPARAVRAASQAAPVPVDVIALLDDATQHALKRLGDNPALEDVVTEMKLCVATGQQQESAMRLLMRLAFGLHKGFLLVNSRDVVLF